MSGKDVPIAVIYSNGDQDFYDNSYCHPLMVPKYTRFERFVGGAAHIITLGLGINSASKRKAWPDFDSLEKVGGWLSRLSSSFPGF